MPLPSGRLFMHVDAARLAAFRGLDTLTIEDGGAGLGLTFILDAYLSDQRGIEPIPQAAARPAPEVAVNGLPRRELFRQHAPLAAGARHIPDAVNDLPAFPFARTAPLIERKEFLNAQPFAILQVGRVGLAEFGHSP